MFEFLDQIADVLEDNLDLFTHIVSNSLDPKPSIALVSMPSGRGDSYYKGKRPINGMFQVLTKNDNTRLAAKTLEEICEFLENNKIVVDGKVVDAYTIDGYNISNIEIYTEPHYIDGDRQSGWTYSAALAVTYTKE